MSTRTRDIAILVVGLAGLGVVAWGGYAAVHARAAGSGARQVLAPVADPTPEPRRSGRPAPQYDRWTVGVAQRPLTVFRRAATDAPVVARLPMRNTADYPTVVLVDSVTVVDGALWFKVWVPVRPNETRGWVGDGQLGLYTTTSKIVIDLSRRRLMVYQRGELKATYPVAVGSPELPTPTGHFYVTQKLRPPYPDGVYGVLQLGTSAFQPKLNDWPDGGSIGIHGTNQPELIGKAISHGCVRMHNADVKAVSRMVPTGSPVDIVK